MADAAFFYGTLMTGFARRRRTGIENSLRFVGRGSIEAALFDVGLYPAAVPAVGQRVWGEVFEFDDPAFVLARLDEIEGHSPDDQDHSLYTRARVTAALDGGGTRDVWVYFYNAPLGSAARISSGDYLDHVRAR